MSITLSCVVNAAVLHVGPGKEFVAPSVAAQFASDGDIIEIEANGIYDGDVVVWKQNNLILRGVSGRPHIRGIGAHAEGKGLWVIRGNDTIIENIEFSGAKVPDKNGAGIRLEGRGLIIRNCYFHHNENGILTGKNEQSDILIEHSEFAWNGFGKGKTHNMYIGRVRKFTLQYNYIHHARVGHNVKTRALESHILYNRIMDEDDGTASYAIDVPNGGITYIVGNLVQQGPLAENWAIISYGYEGLKGKKNLLWTINNTIVNDRSSGVFIKIKKDVNAKIVNNLFIGKGKILEGDGNLSYNIQSKSPDLLIKGRYDYHLLKNSRARDSGMSRETLINLGSGVVPRFEYVHKSKYQSRHIQGPLDVGAYEYVGKK